MRSDHRRVAWRLCAVGGGVARAPVVLAGLGLVVVLSVASAAPGVLSFRRVTPPRVVSMAAVTVLAPTRMQLRSDTIARMLMRRRVDSVSAAAWARYFVHYGERLRLNPRVLVAIAYVESEFKPNARSHAGAIGLMQVVPSRKSWGEYEGRCGPMTVRRLRDPHVNICFGSSIFRWFLTHHRGDAERALSAYNNGTGEPNGYSDRVYATLSELRR